MFVRPTKLAAGKLPVPHFELQALQPQAAVAAMSTIAGRFSLGYQNLSAKQLGERLNVPDSWILDYSNPNSCDDYIPHFSLGKFKRFRWNSPELNAWIERHVICPCVIQSGQELTADYEYLDSAQFAERLNISESWVRDQIRTRSEEPIPHVRLGKYVRFRWVGPELANWMDRRMVAGNNRVVSRAQEKETIQ